MPIIHYIYVSATIPYRCQNTIHFIKIKVPLANAFSILSLNVMWLRGERDNLFWFLIKSQPLSHAHANTITHTHNTWWNDWYSHSLIQLSYFPHPQPTRTTEQTSFAKFTFHSTFDGERERKNCLHSILCLFIFDFQSIPNCKCGEYRLMPFSF